MDLVLGLSTDEERSANLHADRMLRDYFCSVPTPVIVRVSDIHPPGAHQKYYPHCTRLHRCGAMSGCCNSEILECVPRTTETINLYFRITVGTSIIHL